MDLINQKTQGNHRKMEWRFSLLVILYISLLTQVNCEKNESNRESKTKTDKIELDSSQCHTCFTSDNEVVNTEKFVDNIFDMIYTLTEQDTIVNKTIRSLEVDLENLAERALSKDRYEIVDGIEIKPTEDEKDKKREDKISEDKTAKNKTSEAKANVEEGQERALFSKYTYEYRMLQKLKEFMNTHVLSINLPKAAKLIGFRSFGINKFLLPLFIGGQILIKSVLLAMFLPSILGSFGKILGKGISQLSAASSQASYPPMNGGGDEQTAYNNENVVGYETNPAGAYVYPTDTYTEQGDANDLGNVDMTRFGIPGQQTPSKNNYYQMQGTNNYKVFQKIPTSSMILSNYDPFYSPLLSRLDGIFARLGLVPPDNVIDDSSSPQIGGQSIHDIKLEACREQLICLMYASPAKYAPYSNLVSAQLSRELNELRRPVSDNPEIIRFFRYMRAARRGQEGTDCMQAFPTCTRNAAPAHTMIAAYHDINKLVMARKLRT